MIYITGDTHGDMNRIVRFCERMETSQEDIMIILGDVGLSHTVPYDYRPVDLFLSMIDQSTVDESTELWLGEIEKKLDYKWWYAGHYHTSRVRDKDQIMFEDVEEFLHRKLDYQ